MRPFREGEVVARREVLHDLVWSSIPMRVVADDGVLALLLTVGTRMTFPAHPFGPHPWSAHERWTGYDVLQLHRPGDGYSVWGMYDAGRLDHWYVNFQAPYARGPRTVDTIDHGIDIVVRGDAWEWKDREHVALQVAQGRLTDQEGAAVSAAAESVANDLDRGEQWWHARWAGWTPR